MVQEGLIRTLGNTSLYVVQGDITQTPVDAIMTAINPGGMWWGGVDRAIQQVAGVVYHNQAVDASPLKNLDTIVARGDQNTHAGQFNDVVFVVDALESPLNEVVYKGLEAASNAGYESLAMPAVRMGVMLGAVEKTPEATVESLGMGIIDFMATYGAGTKLKNLTFVIYNDPDSVKLIENGMKLLPTQH